MATSTLEEADTASEEDEIELRNDRRASLIERGASSSFETNVDEETSRDRRYLNTPEYDLF